MMMADQGNAFVADGQLMDEAATTAAATAQAPTDPAQQNDDHQVRENPTDFTSWSSLLQLVDQKVAAKNDSSHHHWIWR
jgi:hypothetical protein